MLIASIVAGSHLYGLSTPESDTDRREIIVNEKLEHALGWTDQREVQHIQDDKTDLVTYEVRHFLKLLSRGNTQATEILWTPTSYYTFIDKFFDIILLNKEELTDSRNLYRAIRGYAQHEIRKAFNQHGEGSRAEAVRIYGYSPKNVVHALRLMWSADYLLKTGVYPSCFSKCLTDKSKLLMSIKTTPENYMPTEIANLLAEEEHQLEASYNTIKFRYHFNEKLALDLLLELYGLEKASRKKI